MPHPPPSPPPVDPPRRTLTWHWLRGGAGTHVFRAPEHPETRPHDHVFHEIVLVESGTVEHHTAAGRHALRPGDLIILHPQNWHAYLKPRRLCIVNCLIDAPMMHRLGGLLSPIGGAFQLLRQRSTNPRRTPPTVLHATPAQRESLRQYLDAIMSEQRAEAHGWQAAATAALLQFLVAVARLGAGAMSDSHVEPANQTTRAVLEVATYLERHFTEAVSLEELANRVHLSPAHLSRSFSRKMGMGIIQYLHRIRAEEACRLLRCTDHSISSIASRVGYDEIAYFSRCFRAQIRQSPQQYRKGGLPPVETPSPSATLIPSPPDHAIGSIAALSDPTHPETT